MKKQIKLTPEQQAEETARREAAYKAENERKAALKAQRREDNAKHVAALVETAAMMETWEKVGGVAKEVGQVARSIAWEWQSAHEELSERADRLLVHPADYFEWAEADMKAACKREVLDRILWAVKEGKATLAEIVRHAKDELTAGLLSNRNRPSSTSAAHNATMIYKNEAQAQLLEYSLRRWDAELNPTFKVS